MNEIKRVRRFSWTVSLSMGLTVLAAAWTQARVGWADAEPSIGRPEAGPCSAWSASSVEPASTDVCRLLVEAIVELESAGNPRQVGRRGERGLMQVKAETWLEQTRRLFGRPLSFEQAFDPGLNRRVGLAYLRHLRGFLAEHRARWQGDERALLLACYNAGPGRVAAAGFDVRRLPATTRDYVQRAQALHECIRAERLAQAGGAGGPTG